MLLLVGGILLVALYHDITTAKIPNRLIINSLILCLLYDFLSGGPPLLIKGIIELIITFVVLFSLYLIKAFGAGDIKLICVIASVLGAVNSLKILLFSGLFLIAYRLLFIAVKLIKGTGHMPLEEARGDRVIFILNKGYVLKRIKYSPFILMGYIAWLVYLRL